MFWLLLALILLLLGLWVPFTLHFSWQSRELQGRLHAQLRFLGLCLADYALECGFLPSRHQSNLAVLGIRIPTEKKKAAAQPKRRAAAWPVRPRMKILRLHVRLGIAEDAAATAIAVGTLRGLAGTVMKKGWKMSIQPDFQENILLVDAHGIFCLSLGKILTDRIRRRQF